VRFKEVMHPKAWRTVAQKNFGGEEARRHPKRILMLCPAALKISRPIDNLRALRENLSKKLLEEIV
jgi:hypothetical protein